MRRPALGAAFVALGLVATAGEPSVLNDSSDAAPSSSWVYPELVAGIARRKEEEANLRSYVARVGPTLAALRDRVEACQAAAAAGTPSAASGSGRRCQAELQDWRLAVARVERETAELTWGSVEAQDRRVQFSRDFGCTAWTQEAIDEIKQHSPLIEIGAGNGQWAAALARAGADIVAYDDFSALPLPHRPGERTAILRGNESVLSDWQLLLRPRTLLVVYPEGDLLQRCLRLYQGNVLLFVGEGRGGVNGPPSLFDELERDWVVEKCVEVRPFEGGHERLWVCRRTRAPK